MGAGLGTQLSPVLQAFLAGQGQQADLIEKAKNYGLQKEHIDALVKEIENRHEEAQQAHDLAVQQFKLAGEQHLFEARQQIMQQLRDNPETAPGTTNLTAPGTNMAIPGMASAQVTPNGVSISRGPGDMIPGQPRQVITPPAAGEMVHMDTPYGTISVPMPKSSVQSAVEQQAALAPGKVGEYKATIGSTKEMENAMKGQVAEIRANMEHEVSLIRERSAQYGADSHLAAQLQMERNQMERAMLQALGPEGATAFVGGGNASPIIGRHVGRIAMGEENLSDIPKEIKGWVETAMGQQGVVDPGKGFNDKIYPLAANAVEFGNNVDKASALGNGPPTSIGGKVSRMVQDKLLPAGLSSFASQYNMFRTDELPKLDTAVGLTPGTLARSPKLVDLFKNLYPLPGDSPDVVRSKKVNGTDIYLNGINSKLSRLPVDQRKMYWQKIISDNPELMQMGEVGKKLVGAAQSGKYVTTNKTTQDLFGQ